MDVAFIVADRIISANYIMDILSLIKPKNSLLTRQLYSKAFKALYQELSEFDTKKELLNDMEFLSLACNMAELIVDQQKKHLKTLKIDKMKLVVDCFMVIYDNMTEHDVENLKTQIQFCYDNDLIKKVTTLRYVKKKFSTWISKQL